MKIFLLILSIIVISNSQVLGIDFGTQFWKASLISPGKNLVIVQNSRSGRKSINAIAFHEGVRHFEDDALYKRLKKPHMSYFYLNKLLRSLDFEKPLQGYHFENGTYYITHDEERISLQQLVGMILKNIKLHASSQAGSDIKDVVLAIPANWGWKSKMALINAAYIADLSVLGLVNQNTAAAINFAIVRNDTDPINIGFFNLGSHNLQFSIMQFFGTLDQVKGKNIQSVKVLSHIVVEDVGGLQVDKQIADYLADKFLEKHQVDPRSKEKSYTKLLHKASDIKEILSANKETTVYIQGLINGIDLNMQISRSVIQKMQVFKLLNKHLDEGLQKAGITKDQLHSVQMIGGASRIPLVSKIVKQHFNEIEVGSHINGDEAMAFGSSLRAANLSIAFRVKQLHLYDGFEQEIKCVIASQEGVILEQTLFNKDSQHGDKKAIEIAPTEDELKLTLYYGEQIVKEFISENITQWRTTYNESSHNFTQDPTIVLSFILSTTNIVDLKEAYVNLTLNRTQIKTVDDYVEEEIPQQQNKQTQQETNNSQSQQKDQNTQQEDSNSTQTNTQQNETIKQQETSQASKKPKKRLVKVSKQIEQHHIQNKKYNINIRQTFIKYPKLTKDQISQNKKILEKFQKHQSYLKEKSRIRNELQSTLYRLKQNFQEPYLNQFAKEHEMENLKKVVSDKLEWLDQNAWTAEKDEFQKHYNHVFQAYQPMYNRSLEHRERQSRYNQTMQYLSMTYQKTLELNNTHSWLEDKIEEHLRKINQTVESIHQRLKKQIQLSLNEDPLIYNEEMVSLAQRLRDEYYLLKMIPRPKPKPRQQAKKQSFDQNTEEKAQKQQQQENEQKQENQKEQQEQKESIEEQNMEQQAQSTDQNQQQQREQTQNEPERQDTDQQNEQNQEESEL